MIAADKTAIHHFFVIWLSPAVVHRKKGGTHSRKVRQRKGEEQAKKTALNCYQTVTGHMDKGMQQAEFST